MIPIQILEYKALDFGVRERSSAFGGNVHRRGKKMQKPDTDFAYALSTLSTNCSAPIFLKLKILEICK